MWHHWGDLSSIPDTESGIAAIEREQMAKPRGIDVEGPRLYQPSSRHCPPATDPFPKEVFIIDPVTEHTIHLNQYAKNIRHLIAVVQQQYESVKNGDGSEILSFPSTPPIPKCRVPLSRRYTMTHPVPFMAKDLDSDFRLGRDVALQVFDDVTTRKLLRRSVAVILTHAGYDSCPSSILEIMTDLCADYLNRMTSSLRHLRERETRTGYTGFPDIMDHVFNDMGIGDVTTVHDFYQSRIFSYHKHMMKICQRLVEDYERVKNPEFRNSGEFKLARVKEEPMSDIQFPTLMSDDEEPSTTPSQIESLHGLSGLDVDQESSQNPSLHQDDASKWMNNIKPEPLDSKTVVLDVYDDISEDDASPTPDLEVVHEESGPGVIADMMSPPPPAKIRKT